MYVTVYYTDSLTSAVKLMAILEDREWGVISSKSKKVKMTTELIEVSNKHNYSKCCFTGDQTFILDKEDRELLKDNEDFKDILVWNYIIVDVE